MKIEVSIGEIVDKLTILALKKKYINNQLKLENIQKEYSYLLDIVFNDLKISLTDYDELLHINQLLWGIEDDIRVKEKNKEFDNKFIELARLVYITNDKRADIKRQINGKYGSEFKEEKSYAKY
jgi:hypothetical protein